MPELLSAQHDFVRQSFTSLGLAAQRNVIEALQTVFHEDRPFTGTSEETAFRIDAHLVVDALLPARHNTSITDPNRRRAAIDIGAFCTLAAGKAEVSEAIRDFSASKAKLICQACPVNVLCFEPKKAASRGTIQR